MENNLRCSKVLITGGGSGIGKAIAKKLVDSGAKVTLLGRNIEKLNAVKTELCSDLVFVLQGDISRAEEIKGYIRAAAELMGGLDGLVNNAGVVSSQVTGRGYEPWDITPNEWDTVMDIDLKGAFFMMREAVDYIKEQGIKGNVLNICSNAACMDITGSYGSSKLSLLKMTRALGKRFGRDGIIINGIAPGNTATPMIREDGENTDLKFERHAIGRLVKATEIAELAYYLMSDLGEIICGHTVIADGGDYNATL